MDALRRHGRYAFRRLRKAWATIAAHHHGAAFALCALGLMLPSMATSIQGWTGLLAVPLAYAVGTGVAGFILFLSLLLTAARTRLARFLLAAVLVVFALCLSVPFSFVAIAAGNDRREEAAGSSAREQEALQTATARFVAEGDTVRAQVLANVANARAWLTRSGTAPPSQTLPPGRLRVEEVPPSEPSEPDSDIPPALPTTPAEVRNQLAYLDTTEAEWQDLPLDPIAITSGGTESGWRNLSGAYNRLLIAWGRTRRYLREGVTALPAVPARPVAGYTEAAAGASDPINRAFYRLLHAPRPADGWLLLLALLLDAAPIGAAWTLSLVTPSEAPAPNGNEGPFEALREDLRRIEERFSESGPDPTELARKERDAAWDLALSLSVQRLFLDALETWWARIAEVIARTDADPAVEGRLRALRDVVLAEEGNRPVTLLRQARWLMDTKRHAVLAREARGLDNELDSLGSEAVDAAKRRLATLIAP